MPTEASERRKIYLERKERGYCPRCGKKIKSRIKTTYCEECKKYFADYNKENAERINKTRRDRSLQRKKARKCPRCGEPLVKGYRKTLCVTCLEKLYKYNNGKKRPKKNNDNNFLDNTNEKLDNITKKSDSTKRKLDTATKKSDSTKKKLDTATKKSDGTKKKLDTATKKSDSTKKKLDTAKKKSDGTKKKLATTTKKSDGTKKKLDTAKKKSDGSSKRKKIQKETPSP